MRRRFLKVGNPVIALILLLALVSLCWPQAISPAVYAADLEEEKVLEPPSGDDAGAGDELPGPGPIILVKRTTLEGQTIFVNKDSPENPDWVPLSSSGNPEPQASFSGSLNARNNLSIDLWGSISGHVFEADGETPIANAVVKATGIGGDEAISDSTGAYTITNLLPGPFIVSAEAGGYLTEYYQEAAWIDDANPVIVTAGADIPNIDFTLSIPGAIMGYVYESNSSTPIAGANVLVFPLFAGPFGGQTSTDNEGAYEVGGLGTGSYVVQAEASGYIRGEAYAQVTAGAPSVITVYLDKPASIAGFVYQSDGSTAIEAATVEAVSLDGYDGGIDTTPANGSYNITGLRPGSYYVSARATGYAREYYNGASTIENASTVNMTSGAALGNINFTLDLPGAIAGRVLRSEGLTPIAGAHVVATSTNALDIGYADTDNDGNYVIEGLDAGSYTVMAEASGYAPEYFYDSAAPGEADPVVVNPGATTPDISFTLDLPGNIAGRVLKNDAATPIVGAFVTAIPVDGADTGFATTDSLGTYNVTGLNPGTYKVYVAATNYVAEYYNGASSLETAAEVNVTAGATTPNIDFTLEQPGNIAGRVLQSDGTTPVPLAVVLAVGQDVTDAGITYTGSSGTYNITGLDPGQYIVSVQAEGYIPEYYDGAATIDTAKPVAVIALSTTENIDFTLNQAGKITGHVYRTDGETAIPGANVTAALINGYTYYYAESAGDGSYTISGLPAGEYRVYAEADGYSYEYYNGTTGPAEATPVVVANNTTAAGIDFTLEASGSISGHVFQYNGAPIQNAMVTATSIDSLDYDYAFSDSTGTYNITGLSVGEYHVYTVASGFLSEYYNGVYDIDAAIPVNVHEATDSYGIDFSLDRPGSISGHVFESNGSSPITDAFIRAESIDGLFDNVSSSGIDGSYTISQLVPGDYHVYAQAAGYASEYYNGVFSENEAAHVHVIANGDSSGIDFTLEVPGTITGHVYEADGHTAIPGASVNASPDSPPVYDSADSGSEYLSGQTVTDSDGSYTLTGLITGKYRVYASATGHRGEYYDGTTNYEAAKLVSVTNGNDTPGIDIKLDQISSISGHIYLTGELPFDEAWVTASTPDYSYSSSTFIEEDGSYSIPGLVSGQYLVRARVKGYIPEYYGGAYDSSQAMPVSVTAPNDTTGIDITLELGGSISGHVYQAGANTPVAGARLTADVIDGNDSFWAFTGDDGSYTFVGLSSGQYVVYAEKEGYCNEYYNGKKYYSLSSALPVTAPNNTPDIDFHLDVGGGIAGVISDQNGAPIPYASVSVYDLALNWIDSTYTEMDGSYKFTGRLPEGKFRVSAWADGYAFKFYTDTYIVKAATPIPVAMLQETPNINISLGPSYSISGTVYQPDGISSFEDAFIAANPVNDGFAMGGYTSPDGSYNITGLAPGTYSVNASAEDYAREWYKSGGNTYYYNQATPVVVPAPSAADPNQADPGAAVTTVVTGIDFILEQGGSISGFVYQSNGSMPIKNARVMSSLAYTYGGEDITAADGSYNLTGLAPGKYYVSADFIGYQREYYKEAASTSKATTITVSGGSNTAAINFTLITGGTISGTVYQSDGKVPLRYATVYTYDKDGKYINYIPTTWNGTYQTCGFGAGNYKIKVNHQAFESRWYKNTYVEGNAAPVKVVLNSNLPGIDVDLEANPDIPAGFSIHPTYLPDAKVGIYYEQQLTAPNGVGTLTWSIVSGSGKLPTGITLNSRTGKISGTCKTKISEIKTHTFTVKVTDKSKPKQAATQEFTIYLHPPMTIDAGIPPEGEVGVAYIGWNMTVKEGVAPFIWSLVDKKGTLPPGLFQNTSTGAITGTPNAVLKTKKKYSFTLMATDSLGHTAMLKASITVYPRLEISPGTLPKGEVNITYNKVTLAAKGGKGKISWTFASEQPPGLTIAGNVINKGKPIMAGTYKLVFGVKDDFTTVTREYDLVIFSPPTIIKRTLPEGQVKVAYPADVQLSVENGSGVAKSWSIVSVKGYKFPPGLKLSKAGVISGKPTKADAYTFRVKYTDSLGGVDTEDFTMTVIP